MGERELFFTFLVWPVCCLSQFVFFSSWCHWWAVLLCLWLFLKSFHVCGRSHRGSVCGFLVFWQQITTEPFALFHHSVCDYICFTDELEAPMRTENKVCNLEL